MAFDWWGDFHHEFIAYLDVGGKLRSEMNHNTVQTIKMSELCIPICNHQYCSTSIDKNDIAFNL